MNDKGATAICIILLFVSFVLLTVGSSERVAKEHLRDNYHGPVEKALVSRAFRIYQATYHRISLPVVISPLLAVAGIYLTRRYLKVKREMDLSKLERKTYTISERIIMAAGGVGTAGLGVYIMLTVLNYAKTTPVNNGYVLVLGIAGMIILLGMYWLILGLWPRTQYLFAILENVVE